MADQQRKCGPQAPTHLVDVDAAVCQQMLLRLSVTALKSHTHTHANTHTRRYTHANTHANTHPHRCMPTHLVDVDAAVRAEADGCAQDVVGDAPRAHKRQRDGAQL